MINDTQLSELYPLLYKDGNTDIIPKALSEEDPIYKYLKGFGYHDVSRLKEVDKDNEVTTTKYIIKRGSDVLNFTFKDKEFEPEKHLEFIKFMSRLYNVTSIGCGKTINFTYASHYTERGWLSTHCNINSQYNLPAFDASGYIDYSDSHVLVRMAETRHALEQYLNQYSLSTYLTPPAPNACPPMWNNNMFNSTILPQELTANRSGYTTKTYTCQNVNQK